MRTVVVLAENLFVLLGLFSFSECDSSNERIKRQLSLPGNSEDGFIRSDSLRYQNENSPYYGPSVNVRNISPTSHQSNIGRMDNNRPPTSTNSPEFRLNGGRRPQDSIPNQPSLFRDGNHPISLPLDDPIHFVPDYHSSTIQSRPVAQNENNYYGNSNNQMQRPNLYEINSNVNVRRSQPSQDTYQGNVGVTSQSFGQEGYYGNNPEVGRRPPGQSGYQGNAASVSSTVDSFNGNVNADVGRRPQTSPQDSNLFVSDHNANRPTSSTVSQESHRSHDGSHIIDVHNNENNGNNYNLQNQRLSGSTNRAQNSGSYSSNNDNDDFNNSQSSESSRRKISMNHSQNFEQSNDNINTNRRSTPKSVGSDRDEDYNSQQRKQSRPTSTTSQSRKPGGLNSNSDGNRASTITVDKSPSRNEGNYNTQNNRPVMNPNGSREKRPGGGEGRPLSSNSGYTSSQPVEDENFEENSSTTSNRRTTERTPSTRTGCILPEQPRGGSYELGGCDSPCEKSPGDRVPKHSILTYSCRNGYIQNGSMVSVCLNDSWYMPPSCLRTCPPLESTSVDIICKLRGNTVSCHEPVEPGTTALLACKPSYKIPLTDDPAYREITCLKDGLWDRRLFRCLPKCGSAIAHGNTLVVNGFTAKVGVFPWHVGIYEKKSRLVYEQICAGTLINSNLVVSAAHCFYDETMNKVKGVNKYSVAAGKHYRNWKTEENYAQKSDIDSITVADRYMGARGNFAQDIALVRLKSPFELTDLVRPVCLDWDNVLEREHLQAGRNGKAVGWGKTASGEPSEELQEINLPFVSFDQCLANVPADFRGYITPDKFCAGYMNGSSLCEGDSGGGLCFVSNGLWYLRGIVSVSPAKDYSCDYNSYTGFTYFSHFRDWVRIAFLES